MLRSRTPDPISRFPLLLLAAALAAGTACRREGISHFRVPKESAAPAAPAGTTDEPAPPPAPSQGATLKWTLPSGWSEEKGGGMRYATLKAPGAGKVDISVTFLPGSAGGELANVNRWRGQIGLPPLEEPALAKARTALKTKAGSLVAFDFNGAGGSAGSRMVVGLLTTADGHSWFLKMVGDEAAVGRLKPEFIRLLEGLRLD